MINYEEARQKILENTPLLPKTVASIQALRQSVIAEAVTSPFDMPLFNNSAMDGYAVQYKYLLGTSTNNPATLPLQGIIQAGDTKIPELQEGHVIKIFTGAPVPKNADAVVMKEYCKEAGKNILITDEVIAGENIRVQGEEFKNGQTVLQAGTIITPPVIGLLASLGYDRFKVYQKPSVALIITGNELIQPGNPIQPGEIYESNSVALNSALESIGIEETTIYFAKDNFSETKQVFKKALNDHDVVITVGGISVGDFDFVKDVVESSDIQTIFWRIAMKPGKPVYFGTQENTGKLVFGLPGNPVSALVTFHQLVQPALKKMMGYPEEAYNQTETFSASLSQDLKKKAGRAEFIRGAVYPSKYSSQGFQVTPTTGQQSHMLSGLSNANALIHFPKESSTLNAGDTVEVNRLQWTQ